MKTGYATTLFGLTVAAVLAASAQADILYDATQLNSPGGIYANTYFPANPDGTNLVVDDITVPAEGWTIDTLSVYNGLLLGGDLTTDEAYLVIFPTSLGNVNPMDYATLVSVSQTPETFYDPGSIPDERTVQRFDATGLDLVLAAGDYWIGLTPILSGSNPFGSWSSRTENGNSAMQYSMMHQEWYSLAGGWGNWGPDMMMQIQGVVPEPAALSLTTMMVLVLARRRRGR